MNNERLNSYQYQTEKEFQADFEEVKSNPDFSYIGVFHSIDDIIDELVYQGLLINEIVQLTHNRYGNCLDILEYDSQFHVFIGAR